jgi:hypothetical protein
LENESCKNIKINLNIFEHDRFLFVAFEQGAKGYRYCRQIANENDDIHWYSCLENGVTPLDVSTTNPYRYEPRLTVRQRAIAPNHFDRLVNGKMLPPLFNVIEPYYNDIEEYYPLFLKLFIERGGLDIMEGGKYVMYPVHALRSQIRAKFPNAMIQEIIPDDIDKVVEHYLNTTAKFPAYLRLTDFRPDYLTPYAKKLEENKNATIRDLFNGTNSEYKAHVNNEIVKQVQLRKDEVSKI